MKKILFLLLFAFSLTGFSQALGVLTGKIFEENQSPLFGATVVLEGTTFGAITDELGQFSIPNIPPGTYTIQAGYLGFTSQTVFNFQIKLNIININVFPKIDANHLAESA